MGQNFSDSDKWELNQISTSWIVFAMICLGTTTAQSNSDDKGAISSAEIVLACAIQKLSNKNLMKWEIYEEKIVYFFILHFFQ